MKKKFFLLGICLITMLLVPATSFAWSTPTYTEVWSQPTYTEIWSDPKYTDIWTVPEYTDIWTEDDIVYYELEEGSVRITVSSTGYESYFVLLRSVDFNDFEIYQTLTNPYYDDVNAKAGHTYVYLFASLDRNGNILNVSNYVVVKVLPKKQQTPVTPSPTPTPTPTPAPSNSETIQLQLNSKVATVNGKKQTLNAAPISENGRTLVPIRFISEAMDAKVDWNSKERKITVHLDGQIIVLWVNKKETKVGNKTVYLDVPATVKNGTTFVPIRFISENFGREIGYNNKTKQITIKAKATNNGSNNNTNTNISTNFVGTWDLWVPGGFNPYLGDYTYGQGGDTLQIKSDGTYVWKTVSGKTISGKWVKNGNEITLVNARDNSDWVVKEAQLSTGKGIRVHSFGVYYEGMKR